MIGYSQDATGGQSAFLYEPTEGTQDLNDLVSDPKGLVIWIARFSNARGEVLAEGHNPGHKARISPFCSAWRKRLSERCAAPSACACDDLDLSSGVPQPGDGV